jgi:hypothetical protein
VSGVMVKKRNVRVLVNNFWFVHTYELVSSIDSKRPVRSKKRFSSDSKLSLSLRLPKADKSRCQKQNLSACVVDEAEDTARHFTQDDLRQLFKFNTETICDTHDTFKCKRCRDGKQFVKAPALLYGDPST